MYDMMPPSGKMSPEYNYFNYQASYLKNSRAIGVLWCVFSMCYAIINVVVFLQPQWLGDTEISKGTGYFGLWKHCRLLQDGQDLICKDLIYDYWTRIERLIAEKDFEHAILNLSNHDS